MSATLEIISSSQQGDNSQVMLPAFLRNATYISAGGRVYRLFPEEETSLNTEPFRLDLADIPVIPLKAPCPLMKESITEDAVKTVQKQDQPEPLQHIINGLGDGQDDPKMMLKLFEAFSETSPSRLKKSFVSNAEPTIKINEKTTESTSQSEYGIECSVLKISSPLVLPFSILATKETEEVSENEDAMPDRLADLQHEKPIPAGFSIVPLNAVSDIISNSVSTDQSVSVNETLSISNEIQEDIVPETSAIEVTQPSTERSILASVIRLTHRFPSKQKRLFSPKKYMKLKARRQTLLPPPIASTVTHTSAPKIKSEPPVQWPVYLNQLEETASEQVRLLADTLEEQRRQGHKTLSFNSIRLGDGCTTLCLCAARELARRGFHVLLADAHKQHPELPDILGLTIDPSLYELITLIPERLDLLPWSEVFLEFDEQNNGMTRTFADVVTSLREEYDMVLLDHGCLTETMLDDPVRQWKTTHTDGVLLVLNTLHPSPFDPKTIVRKLLLHDVAFIGVAENYV